MYLHETVLCEKAKKYISLLEQSGIDAEIVMVRDYLIKLAITKEDVKYGNLIIDYKAKRGTFSIRMQELKDKSIEDILQMLWNGGDSPRNTLKVSTAERAGYDIYVDGSFLNNNVGYGAVILKGGQVLKEISGLVSDPIFTGSRQVGGEIMAVLEALEWCKEKTIDQVSIFYDLENLKKWVTGEYSANIPMSKTYKDYVKNCNIGITWNKVLAHSGVKWNERADELAKQGTLKDGGSSDTDLISELKKNAEEFALHLENNGYIAEFLEIYNNMAAKVCIEREGETLGYVNIYNTEKLHLQPRYHEIKQAEIRDDIERLWGTFRTIQNK